MPWKECSVMDERLRFVAKLLDGESMTDVCREFGISRKALAEPPRIGRKVPELNDPQLREISAFSWRILYHLREGNVFIVTLIHKRRQPGAEDLTPD